MVQLALFLIPFKGVKAICNTGKLHAAYNAINPAPHTHSLSGLYF
jgi:hypothetical protein